MAAVTHLLLLLLHHCQVGEQQQLPHPKQHQATLQLPQQQTQKHKQHQVLQQQ